MAVRQLGVIFGSRSCEREVSIISALQMMRYADPEKYRVVPIYIHEDGTWYTGDKLKDIRTYQPFNGEGEGIQKVFLDMTSRSGALLHIRTGSGLRRRTEVQIVARIDVFLLVMHGLNGEDGTLQGMLELANMPYSSTGVTGSAIGMDKIMMKQFFRGGDLPVLPGEAVNRSAFRENPEETIARVEEKLGYPVFVKPANLGSSIGVSRADDREGLRDSLSLAFEYDRRVLVEKGLDQPIELNCSVLGFDGEVCASPIEMPVSHEAFLDFGEKYLASGGSKGMASLHRILPAPIEDELRDSLQQMSMRIFRMLDCKGVVRIDYMFDRAEGKIYITEINTIPGSLAFYLWENAGMPYARLIDRLVEYAEKAWQEKNEATYAFTSNILQGAALNGAKSAKGAKGAKGGMGAKTVFGSKASGAQGKA